MRSMLAVVLVAGTAVAAAVALRPEGPATSTPTSAPTPLLFPGEEKFLANVRQLTFGGQTA